MIRRFNFAYSLFVRGSDTLIVGLALLLSTWLRRTLPFGEFGIPEAFTTPPILYVTAAVLWQIALHLVGIYKPANSAWFWRELQRTMIGHAIASFLFFGVLYLTLRDYSRLQTLYFVALAGIGLISFRLVLRFIYKLLGKPFSPRRLAIVVGTDANAERVGKTISMYGWTGLTLLGYVKQTADDPVFRDISADQILGTVDDLPSLVGQHNISEVVIALRSPDHGFVARMMDMLQYHVTNIRLAPDYSDLAYFHVSIENFGGLPLIGLREAVLSPAQRAAKRLFDVSVSLLMLALSLPLFLIIALAIRLESPGPIFFIQERIGEHGRRFKMVKFRSMYKDADKMQVVESVDHKQRHDPRVTRVGDFIRRTSLDELPQFVNILRGDMSLVGPRPEIPWLVDKYEAWQRKRFEVPQGLTGWWQVTGRADKPLYLNTEDDLFYIRNYSLWLDVQILFRTILVVVTGRGAF